MLCKLLQLCVLSLELRVPSLQENDLEDTFHSILPDWQPLELQTQALVQVAASRFT